MSFLDVFVMPSTVFCRGREHVFYRPRDQYTAEVVDDNRPDNEANRLDNSLTDDPPQPMLVEPFINVCCV